MGLALLFFRRIIVMAPTCCVLWLLCFVVNLGAQTAYLEGQFSTWLNISESKNDNGAGLRYLPGLYAEKYLSANVALDTEVSLNAVGATTFFDGDKSGNIDPYRVWLRLTTTQMEVRAGLQKINFGTAKILRSLMWFDRIDPRDPQQITDGVYGMLAKYTFLNNANIWAWGLYGNNGTKGLEVIPSKENSFEFGGRAQHPVATGEMALSYHHRTVDPGQLGLTVEQGSENRVALDGIWDAEIAFWFETVLVHQDIAIESLRYRNLITLGADYTFGVGSGLHVLAEHLWLSVGDKAVAVDERNNITALLADYSFSFLDRFVMIVTRSWEAKQWSWFGGWGRTYDNWSFYLNLFWRPDQVSMSIIDNSDPNTFGLGKGIQLLAVFNH